MNTTSRRIRLLTASLAMAVTFGLFQSVASLAKPSPAEQMARARAAAVTVASVR